MVLRRSARLLLSLLAASAALQITAGCGHDHDAARSYAFMAKQHLRSKQLRKSHPKADRTLQEGTIELGPQGTAHPSILQPQLLLQKTASRVANSSPLPSVASPAPPAPLRISVEYQSTANLSPQVQANLVAITRTVMSVLSTYLMVRTPVTGMLLAAPMCYRVAPNGHTCQQYYPTFSTDKNTSNREDPELATCGLAQINPAHVLDLNTCRPERPWQAPCRSQAGVASNVAADMVLYVTSIQDDQCNSGAAGWARPCLFDASTNRPVLGNANVCPYALMGTDTDQLVAVLVHEVIHALGFTSSLYSLYINPATNQELPINNVVKTATVDGKQVTRIVTPTVAREAQAQFGCPSLDGAQLEDEGGEGSANSHWEYTHYQGEVMVASTMFAASGEPPRLSRLTLALLEDSGWYLANWTAAGGPMQWALNSGCTLPTQGCAPVQAATSPTTSQQLFCDPAAAASANRLRYACSASLRSVGQCRNTTFSNGCGMVSARGGGPSCSVPLYQYANADVFGWFHGPTSRCYPVSYRFMASTDEAVYSFPANGREGDQDAVCFPTTCREGQQYLIIAGKQLRCPSGRSLDLSQAAPDVYRRGMIVPCPNEAATCVTLDCGGQPCTAPGGSCFAGRCYCRLGWTGADCSLSLVSGTRSTPSTGSGDSSTPPADSNWAAPPPAQRNVTTYFQLIQIACALNKTSSAFYAAASSFKSVLGAWADVNAAQLSVASATTNTTSSGANTTQQPAALQQGAGIEGPTVSTTHTVVRQSLWGAIEAAAGRHLAAVQPKTVVPTAQAMTRSSAASEVQPCLLGHSCRPWSRRLAGASAPPPSGTVAAAGAGALQVMVHLRPASSLQADLVMAKLGDPSQVSWLSTQLQAAGFLLIPSTLSAQVVIVQETVSEPANPIAQTAIISAQGAEHDSASLSAGLARNILTIAVAVGGSVALLASLVALVACLRSRGKAAAVHKPKPGLPHVERRPAGSIGGHSAGGDAGNDVLPDHAVLVATTPGPKQSRLRPAGQHFGGATPASARLGQSPGQPYSPHHKGSPDTANLRDVDPTTSPYAQGNPYFGGFDQH